MTQFDVIELEHSVANMMPFVEHYLPKAKVVPIIVSRKTNLDDIKNFLTRFGDVLKREDVLLLASIDFAHYVSLEEAEKNDKETESAIKKVSIREILGYDNDHLDSPETLVAILLAMKKNGNNNLEVLHNTNSGILMQEYNENVTSYFGMIFY